MYAMKGNSAVFQSWDYYENILSTNDLSASYTAGDIVPCVTILVREFSGKISRITFTEASFATPDNRQGQDLSEDGTGFLYEAIDKYDSYDQCVIVFFQELGDRGTWESVKGVGAKAYRHLTASNQLKCKMLALSEMFAGLILQIPDTKSKDAMQLIRRGLVTYAPPGAKAITQAQPSGYLDGPITLDRVLSNHLANNLGQYNPRTLSREDGKGEMPTATQVDRQSVKEASLSQGQMSIHYTTLDSMFSEMFRRASKKGTTDDEAKLFQKQCKDAGVPIEALQDCIVKTNRLSGYGSADIRQLSDEQMEKVVEMLPEDGKNNWLKDFVGGVKGADKIERYVPTQHIPDDQDWQVSVENSMIHQGVAPPVVSGQDDVIHCTGHLQDAQQTLVPVAQALQQGQKDPQQLQSALQYVQIMAPHLELHIGRLEKDPYRKQEAKLFQDQFNQMVAITPALHGAVRDAQRQQQIDAEQQQQASSLGALDQAKVQSAKVDDSLKTQKALSDINRKNVKAANDARLKTITTLHTMRLKTAEAATPALNGAEK
jgi:hypothetical protein